MNLLNLIQEYSEILTSSFVPMLEGAIYYSIPLALISFIFGMLIALAIAFIKVYDLHQSGYKSAIYCFGLNVNLLVSIIRKVVLWIVNCYISIIRGTPLLVQLFIIFFGLPNLGIKFSPFYSAIIAFSLNVGAYATETIRAAILSVSKSQWEAAFSIGMTRWRTITRIILPQAIRVAIPPLSNTFISLVKDTSLASIVMIVELFRVAQNISSSNYEFLLVYSEAAFIYWIICLVLSSIQNYLEAKLSKNL